jgi:hypothetical protein
MSGMSERTKSCLLRQLANPRVEERRHHPPARRRVECRAEVGAATHVLHEGAAEAIDVPEV